MHKACLEKRLKLKWSSKEISFNYMKCPVCNSYAENISSVTNNKEILNLFEEAENLKSKIEKLAKIILNEEKLTDEFEVDKYSFYLCDKCGNPFCAGLKECREEDDEEEKKLCLDCFDYNKIKGITNCKDHGRKHIQYKCKFCCNVSSHFCFGTTHFCEDCHLQQLKEDFLTSKSAEELLKCPGKELCALKIEHAPNGEEFGICCLLCLNNN
jgi:E3 ubiquitin-protein ligase MYCBP2